ncbi:MAG: polyprenyl synthetase family protein [SAR86 cluster bacterium]|nr:polyprenyl synthetase family protein [SAR86 cluster bacterium]
MELIYKNLLTEELDSLEVNLVKSISSDISLASEISNYLVSSGGKRIRPVICILIAKTYGYKGKDLIKLATSIELLHTATLIHDDVVDQSLVRRGKQSIQAKWDNAHGVLVGDFVYSKAFQLMASFENSQIIKTLADSTNKISEGEVLQLALKNKEVLSEEDYFEIIDRKTAELFKSSAVTAGILSSCDMDQLSSLARFATSLGISFQIQDDILDYFGNEELTGKKLGKDFEEGKFTLPILIALKKMSDDEKSKFLDMFELGKKDDFSEILALLSLKETITDIQDTFNYYSNICKEELNKMPDNRYKEALNDIVINLDSRLT